MTNIEKIIAEGKLELFKEMQKGDNIVFCRHFGIPMNADTSYDLQEWMLAECEDELASTVKQFIGKFSEYGNDVIRCFTQDNCYWFAKILCERFSDLESKPIMMYSPIDNHFTVKIGTRLYDITGDVTETYEHPSRKTVTWHYYKISDSTEYARIVRDCINKTT